MTPRPRKILTAKEVLQKPQPLPAPVSAGADSTQEVHPIWGFRWGWYLFSLFIPMAGILIGILFYDLESKEARKVGKRALTIGFLFWVVLPMLFTLLLLLVGGLALFSWISSVVGPAD